MVMNTHLISLLCSSVTVNVTQIVPNHQFNKDSKASE